MRRQWALIQEAEIARVIAEQEARAEALRHREDLDAGERERSDRELRVRKEEVERRVALEAELALAQTRLAAEARLRAAMPPFPVGLVLAAVVAMVMTVGVAVVMVVHLR